MLNSQGLSGREPNNEKLKSVFTCGEDGFVRAWKPVDEDGEEPQSEGASTKPKKQKKKDRFKPY